MKTLITRIKRLALALCFVTPLVSWADAITAVNPVTGETETYTYKYVGTGDWTATDWQNAADPVANPDKAPQTPSSNVWDPILIDGSYTLTAPTLEGWAIRLGLYNGAKVTVPTLNKIQAGTTMWFTVDATSKLTLSLPGTGHLGDNQNVNFYVAAPQGLVFNSNFATSQNDTDTFNYYLAGDGSVSFQGISAGTHKIKMADVTLSGSATPSVESKTLVSFTSTTKTFTADAAIKVYGIDGTTLVDTVNLATVNTTGSTTLTEESAVGTCELVQCTDGIVLYYVDGDPDAVVAKTYLPSISVNFCHGNAPLTTAADVGVVDYAVPGTSWNNMISAGGNNGTFSTPLTTIYKIDSTGATSLISGASVAVSGTRGSWDKGNVPAGSDVRNGYIDDNDSNASPQFVVEGIPYYSYKTIIYFGSDNNDTKFGYVTVNGENFKGDLDNTATVAAEVGDIWGAASETSFTEGGNYLVIPTQVNTDGTLTVVSHRLAGCRAGLAAVQIIEVPKTAEEGELVINVSGDTTYTVSKDATYTTVYVTGTGTLAFDGEGAITTTTLNVGAGATVPMGSSITPNTVVGAGTVVYDGAQPSTALGFDNSDKWFGTVWVKNIGSNGESSKVSTVLGTDTATATDNVLKDWGNENSSVKFTNVRGWTGTAVCPWTLILEDDSTNYAWYNNNGYAARSTTFAALKGSGTFYDKLVDNKPCRQKITFTDGSQFTGALYAEGKRVGLGGENTRGDAEDNNGTIEVVSGATATVASGKTWTAGTGSILVTGTLYANGTLAGTSTTRAVRGSGTVVFTGSAPSPTGDAWWKNSDWTGTVELNAATAIAGWEFNNYGHSGSTLRLNNCRGWLKANYTCNPALEIVGTFTWSDGSSGLGNTFKVGTLKGSGTISIPTGGAPTAVWQITDDWSGFTGAVVGNNTDGRRMLVFGPTLPATVEAGEIYVSDGATLNLGNASATWWTLGKGFVVDGTVVSPNRDKWGGGTAMTLGDTGVLELTSAANTQDYKNYSGVTGTGTIKYSSTAGWRLFPDTSAKMPATTLTIQTELADSLIIACTNDTVIGNLAGSKNIRSDWGDNSANGRTLTVTQSKDTEWSGKFVSNRITQFNVNPGASTTGTLTLSGTQTVTMPATISGSVNLTGTWVGATTVSGTFGGTGTLTGDLTFSDGATFKANASALTVSGTVTIPVGEGESLTIDATGLDADEVTILSSESITTETDVSKVTVDGLYTVEAVAGALKLVSTKVAVTIPAIANATVTVSVGGETIGTEAGTYKVAPDAVVTATYAAEAGYEISGQTVYTINVANSETTFDPAGTTEVKQYVASITVGETTTKYTTLQAAIDAVAQNKDIVLLANEADGATVSREVTFTVTPGDYTYGTIVVDGDYILTTTVLEGKTRYSVAPAVIAVTINDVRTPYSMINATSGIEAANAGPIGTTIEILSGNNPQDYVDYLPMFDLNTETGVFTKVANPVAAVYEGVIQQQVYRTLAAAIEAAEDGQTVKLLADLDLTSTVTIAKDVTLDLNEHNVASLNCRAFHVSAGAFALTGSGTVSATADENVNTSTFPTSSSVIRVGSNDATTSFTLGENVTVTSDYCYGITYFGKQAQTVVIDGTVDVTSVQAAISGNGTSTLAATTLTVNGTVSATQDYAIYNPQAGTTAINGTVTGRGGVEVKGGTVTVGATAKITATGTPSYTQSNQDGTSTVGYAIASVGNSSYKQPAVVNVEDGATVNGTVIIIKENKSETYGTVNSAVNTLAIPEGFVWSAVESGYTLAVVQEVPVEAGAQTEPVETRADAEADAAKVVPTVPAAVAAKLSDDQETAYKALFEPKVVEVKVGETTKYAVAVELKDTVVTALQTAVDAEAEDLATAAVAAAADATNGGKATVATTPGLYYVVEAGTEPNGTAPVSCTLAESGSTTLTIPNKGAKGFYKIRVSVTYVDVQE